MKGPLPNQWVTTAEQHVPRIARRLTSADGSRKQESCKNISGCHYHGVPDWGEPEHTALCTYAWKQIFPLTVTHG